MTLPFIFTDGTSIVKLLAFTDDAKKILETTAEHLYAMSYQGCGFSLTMNHDLGCLKLFAFFISIMSSIKQHLAFVL